LEFIIIGQELALGFKRYTKIIGTTRARNDNRTRRPRSIIVTIESTDDREDFLQILAEERKMEYQRRSECGELMKHHDVLKLIQRIDKQLMEQETRGGNQATGGKNTAGKL